MKNIGLELNVSHTFDDGSEGTLRIKKYPEADYISIENPDRDDAWVLVHNKTQLKKLTDILIMIYAHDMIADD